MKKVVVKNDVLWFLDELITELFREEYFGFLESSEDYVNTLYDAIYHELPNLRHYTTPYKLRPYGKYYVKIKSNKRTTWYVFFDKMANRYFVEFITNNHTPQAAHFNKL